MTVINMMSFGESGAAVADEQSSGRGRKYNDAQKLREFPNQVIYGGSGGSDFINEVYELTNGRLIEQSQKEGINLRNIYESTQESIFELKEARRNGLLLARFGFENKDLLAGRLSDGTPLDEGVKKDAKERINEFEHNNPMNALVGGIEDGKFQIYEADTEGYGSKSVRPYASIGSGSDESGKILSSYFIRMPRHKRNDVSAGEGLSKLIEATNASSDLNVGVGGIPSIAYVTVDGISYPNEENCILAGEIITGLTWGQLDRNFAYESVEELVTGSVSACNADPKNIEEKMKEKAKDWDTLDRILRGYKIVE